MVRALWLSCSLWFAGTAIAADPNSPHPHQGVLRAYPQPPPAIALTPEDLATLSSGGVVRKQTRGEEGGRGVAVQDVHATPEVIWAKILDFAAYPRMVENVYECQVYSTTPGHVKTRFLIGSTGISVEYFIDHVVRTDQGWATWTLDYTRESDLDDSVGYWRVDALADRPGWSRVTYSVDVKLRGWVPGFVESMLSRSGLTKATAWVKREAEAAG
jgi:hypothetical protein